MKARDALQKQLDRLTRVAGFVSQRLQQIDVLYAESVKELEDERKGAEESLRTQETRLKSQIDQAGKDFTQKKFQLERESAVNQNDILRFEEECKAIVKKAEQELARLNEERVNIRISSEKQKSALNDLYQEKRRHLSLSKGQLTRDVAAARDNLEREKSKYQNDLKVLEETYQPRIAHLKDQAAAKRQGWEVALETMRRNLEALKQERELLEKRLGEIKGEKEKELDSLRLSMRLEKEQLDVDKATLIEKAEQDQKQCEADIQRLRNEIAVDEKELESLVLNHSQRLKDAEEAYQREEAALKEAVKTEAEKRDYEQKLFEQEKSMKEKELSQIREEYDKKKWYWDNQIRTLMMKKSVQDAEFDAERLRVDREARVILRNLEAKREELKQRLGDLKSRHEAIQANNEKETVLMNQRWTWRKERLWSMWQNRLDVLKKERAALHQQIEAVEEQFKKEKGRFSAQELREGERIDSLQTILAQGSNQKQGQRRQREVQLELEKTRLLAQIKECEQLVTDWLEKIRATQDEVARNNAAFLEQIQYLDRWYREEEKETTLFLHHLQRAVAVFEDILIQTGLKKAA